jgi:ABC-2 type transport system permease protein
MTATNPMPVADVRVPAAGLRHQVRAAAVVWQREMIRFSRDRSRIVSSLVQPVLFLFVLGSGLASLVSSGDVDFRTFLFPGVLAPVSTLSILTGKCLGGATVATLQSLIILLLAGLVGVPYDPMMMLELVGLLFLMAFMICAMGLFLSARIKQVQSAMPLVQLTITPLMFLSGSLFPLSNLPGWLHVATIVNPMTYAVEPIRSAVFDRLDLSPAARATFDPGITWAGWHVPVPLQVAIVFAACLVLLGLAVARFARTE